MTHVFVLTQLRIHKSFFRHTNPKLVYVSFQLFAYDAQNIWKKMTELNPTKEVAYYITHDGRFNEFLTLFWAPDQKELTLQLCIILSKRMDFY